MQESLPGAGRAGEHGMNGLDVESAWRGAEPRLIQHQQDNPRPQDASHGQVAPHTLATSPTQTESHAVSQQYESTAQMAATHGSQDASSATPSTHVSWMQPQSRTPVRATAAPA